MAEDKPRLARLSAIITQLQSKRIVTARDIADKYDISIRTVYRDIRTLEKSGIPIVTEEGRGYSIMEGYKLPPVMFTEEEAMALITVEQLVLKNKDKSLSDSYVNAVTKIKSILQHTQKKKTEFLTSRLQIRDNKNDEKTSQYLIQLQSYIANFQVIQIDYVSLSEYKSQRHIEPFALYTTQDNWILIAYCRQKSDFRAFRLDRIQRIKPINEYFEPHNMTLEQYLEQCRKTWDHTPDIPLSQGGSTFGINHKTSNMQKVKIDPFYIIGITVKTTNENGQAAKDIGELWGRFMTENTLGKIPNRVADDIYSVYSDYEGDHTKPYTTILGCKVSTLDDVPAGMMGKTLGGGDFYKTSAKGDLSKGLVVNKWSEIWGMDLERLYTGDYEVYGENAKDPSDAEVEFFVAVK